MEEQTGTADELIFEASDMDTGATESTEEQTNEVSNSSAVEETTEQSENQKEATEDPAVESTETTQTGDAIDQFLAKKGINPNDPNAIRKIAEMYQNSEKGFYSKSQEAAQLQRRLAEAQTTAVHDQRPEQQALSEVRQMRIEMDTKQWKADHKLTPEDEQLMVEYVTAPLTDRKGNVVSDPNTGVPFTRAMLVNNGVLSLDDVYRLAGCGVQKVDNLKDAYREEVRKEMAARQAAKRPSSNATDSTQFGKAEEDDPFVSGLFGS